MHFDRYFRTNWTAGEWKRYSAHVRGGSGVGDASLLLYELSASTLSGRQELKVNASGTNILHPQGWFGSVNINGFARDTARSHPTFDDVYIAVGESAGARVELGDHADYGACTKLSILTVTHWSASQLQCTVRLGQLAPRPSRASSPPHSSYLFVVDAQGRVSSGFPVVLGTEAVY
jgi:hypothetical protein